jgi:riboflavin synthase
MFTGLVADIGTIESVDSGEAGARIRIGTGLAGEIREGDSVAVDGVCLTATAVDATSFETKAMRQTLSMTGSAMLVEGDRVNLELAMRASDRLGGHIVQGHVDGVGEIVDAFRDGFARRLRVGLGPSLMAYAIPQGSIALDGVSLTIAEMTDEWLGVSLIPETLERTTLGEAAVGDKLNIECDVVAKYVERLMKPFVGEGQA